MADCAGANYARTATPSISTWLPWRKPLAAPDANASAHAHATRCVLRRGDFLIPGLPTLPMTAHPIHLNQSFHIADTSAMTASLDAKQSHKSVEVDADSLRRDRRRKTTSRSSSGHISKKEPHSHLHPL